MKEKEIRPKKIFNKFLYLTSKDSKKYFSKSRSKINCIACNSKGKLSFRKKNFSFYICEKCRTLFVNPRPEVKDFKKFYQRSSSIKFLSDKLYKKTTHARKNKIFKPRAKMIYNILKNKKIKNYNFVDIGGGTGIFAKEMFNLTRKKTLVIEPSNFLAKECKRKKLPVIEKFLEDVKREDLPSSKKIFTCFELIEHLHSPTKFIKNLSKLMNKEDLFIFTTLSSTGADILTLWNNSRAVIPPHHINFFNPKSIKIFLLRNKFKIISVTTPGKLDIDILDSSKNLIEDRFWKTFLYLSSNEEKVKMQNFLNTINFSSHMMVICKK